MADRCIVWCPTRDAEQFAHDLSAPVLLATTPKEDRPAIIARFGETDRGVLVVATTYGIHGYHFPAATAYFFDGCPTDQAWRWQARARSERR